MIIIFYYYYLSIYLALYKAQSALQRKHIQLSS